MKGPNRFSKGFRVGLINTALILTLLFLLLPPGIPGVLSAHNDNHAPEIIEKHSVTVDSNKDSELETSDKKIHLRVHKGTVDESMDFELARFVSPGSTGMQMVNFFELNATTKQFIRKVHEFKKDMEITIQHTPEELAGLDIDSLSLYYLNEETGQWELIPGKLDKETLTLTAKIKHFSYFGEQANPLQSGPGKVMAAQVGLSSGTATYSYPIELPPGPGGFTPSLTLNYNSGSVDGMKNKRDVGSWVGIGWSLNFGKITYSEGSSESEYSLDLNGASYKLVSTDGTNFHTNPEEYLKITRSGNTWTAYDKSGTEYRFGGTTDSQQYNDTSDYYRWDLSYWKDTNGNEATVSYVQDIFNSSVRSAYPVYLRYDNNLVEVRFFSSSSENSTYGPVRMDNPVTYDSNPVPKNMENRQLDSIEIKVSGNLTRKYNFSYTTTDRVYSSDYSGIYYSGQHKLNSVTQVGADGSSTLPATSFSYQDKQVFRKTTETQYIGNPGNPAILTWPFLTTIDSGYGGSVSFTYTQIPDTSVLDTWTRQAVTSKDIYDGSTDDLSLHTMTFYPDADPEATSVDGYVGRSSVTESWAPLVSGAGTYALDTDSSQRLFLTYIIASTTSNIWTSLFRGITLFDTSGLPDNATITGATLSIYGLSKSDDGAFTPDVNVYSSNPASNTTLQASDYNTLGNVAYCDTPITHAGWSTTGYNDFVLNSTGLAAISKTGVSKFGFRNASYDTANISPTWVSGKSAWIIGYEAEKGAGYAPKLVVTYYSPSPAETHTYTYTGNPQYKGTGWNQEFRGWNEVKETDAANNYVKHYFYTTGNISGKDAEILTGKEYQTKWYDSTNTLLNTKTYDWCSENETVEGQLTFYSTPSDSSCILSSPTSYSYVHDSSVGGACYSNSDTASLYNMRDYSYNYKIARGFLFFDTSLIGENKEISSATLSLYGCIYSTESQEGICDIGVVEGVQHEPVISSDYGDELSKTTLGHDAYYDYDSGWGGAYRDIELNSVGIGWINKTGTTKFCIRLRGDILSYAAFNDNYVAYYNNEKGTGYQPKLVVDYVTQFYRVYLSKVEETIGTKTTRTEYVYDDYGNVITTKNYGDISTSDDDSTIHRVFYSNNTTAYIVNKPARERVYATISEDVGGANLKKETLYYYDSSASYTTPPTKGNLTGVEQKKDASNSVSSNSTYDTYGNLLTSRDPNGNTTTWTFDTTYHVYPLTKTMPLVGTESYTYAPGTTNLLSMTDVNSQTTTFEYDTFGRMTKVIKPGDSSGSPSVEYQYNNWGTINQQNIKTITKVDASTFLWQTQYFDGIGRVIQTHTNGESGHTIIAGTTTFNNRGLVDKQYVSQDYGSILTSYQEPNVTWKYSSSTYDGLGRVVTQTGADGTSISHDYSTAWQDTVTNQRGYKTRFYYDAFRHLVKVEELNASHQLYATTTYTYDTLGNLLQVVDNNNNATVIAYDWLSRKTGMIDPDMGTWSYGYDSNGNLVTQTDAKSQTITMTYDALNRLVSKAYPAGSNMTNVYYGYDSGTYGKGQRTSMIDATGNTTYTYDNRGRLIQESRIIDAVSYVTSFTYDGANRPVTTTYPTGETVTQTYNGQGLPYSLSGSSNTTGTLVSSVYYNNLGSVTEIDLCNGLKTTFGYYGTDGAYDTTGGYYGKLWEVKTLPQSGGNALQDVRHTWDAGGNLVERHDMVAGSSESFEYDFLDRLINAKQVEDDWLYGWANRVKITIDSSKIDADLTHFPVLIHLSSDCGKDSQDLTEIFDEVGANYQKIAVTSDNGKNQLYVEVESWDANNEEAWLWVSKSGWNISGTEDTSFYLYYDASHEDNTTYVGLSGSEVAEMVWDANYVLVDHMADNPDVSHTADSTANDNDGTKLGANEPAETTGKVGDGQSFDGNYDSNNFSNGASLAITGSLTLEAIIKPDAGISATKSILSKQQSSTGGYFLDFTSGYSVSFGLAGITPIILTSTEVIAVGAWAYVAGIFNSTTNARSIIVGTTLKSDTTNGSLGATSNNLYAGRYSNTATQFFPGLIDEIRVSNTARSAAWLKANYYSSYDDLLSFSVAQTENNWLTGWHNRVKITIASSLLEGDLTNIPVLIHISASCGQGGQDLSAIFDELGTNYKKLAVTTDDGQTQLYVEVEKWDAVNEDAILRVSKPGWSLSVSKNTIIYLYFDNTHEDNSDYVLSDDIIIFSEIETRFIRSMKISIDLTSFSDIESRSGNTSFMQSRAMRGILGSMLPVPGFVIDLLGNIARGARDGGSSSANYTETYTYNEIGNIMSRNGVSYTYGTKPHAVTSVGANMTYTYDANGNMLTRDDQTLTWDVENRLIAVTQNSTVIAQFFYDGDGNRYKKIENGETVIYVNQYYEKNLTTGNVTSSYYLGSRLVAAKENDVLRYVHQDHLTGTSLMTDSSGAQIDTTMKYLPFGQTLTGSVPTDKKFTGQRLDETGLYYYGARYYDATIGRFVSADTIVPSLNPQCFNRYSYCLNNPLKYVDPSGHDETDGDAREVIIDGINISEMTISEIWYLYYKTADQETKGLILGWIKFYLANTECAQEMMDAETVWEINEGDLLIEESDGVITYNLQAHANDGGDLLLRSTYDTTYGSLLSWGIYEYNLGFWKMQDNSMGPEDYLWAAKKVGLFFTGASLYASFPAIWTFGVPPWFKLALIYLGLEIDLTGLGTELMQQAVSEKWNPFAPNWISQTYIPLNR